jgi:hypothetical protein
MVAYCEDLERLRGAFLALLHKLNELQAQQIEAVTKRDPDFTRFDDLIHIARAAKDDAKYALIAHIEEHKCW